MRQRAGQEAAATAEAMKEPQRQAQEVLGFVNEEGVLVDDEETSDNRDEGKHGNSKEQEQRHGEHQNDPSGGQDDDGPAASGGRGKGGLDSAKPVPERPDLFAIEQDGKVHTVFKGTFRDTILKDYPDFWTLTDQAIQFSLQDRQNASGEYPVHQLRSEDGREIPVQHLAEGAENGVVRLSLDGYEPFVIKYSKPDSQLQLDNAEKALALASINANSDITADLRRKKKSLIEPDYSDQELIIMPFIEGQKLTQALTGVLSSKQINQINQHLTDQGFPFQLDDKGSYNAIYQGSFGSADENTAIIDALKPLEAPVSFFADAETVSNTPDPAFVLPDDLQAINFEWGKVEGLERKQALAEFAQLAKEMKRPDEWIAGRLDQYHDFPIDHIKTFTDTLATKRPLLSQITDKDFDFRENFADLSLRKIAQNYAVAAIGARQSPDKIVETLNMAAQMLREADVDYDNLVTEASQKLSNDLTPEDYQTEMLRLTYGLRNFAFYNAMTGYESAEDLKSSIEGAAQMIRLVSERRYKLTTPAEDRADKIEVSRRSSVEDLHQERASKASRPLQPGWSPLYQERIYGENHVDRPRPHQRQVNTHAVLDRFFAGETRLTFPYQKEKDPFYQQLMKKLSDSEYELVSWEEKTIRHKETSSIEIIKPAFVGNLLGIEKDDAKDILRFYRKLPENLNITLSRDLVDILRASAMRQWSTCLSPHLTKEEMDNGLQWGHAIDDKTLNLLAQSTKNRFMVAYIGDADDTTLQRPAARALIVPLQNESTGDTYYQISEVYGFHQLDYDFFGFKQAVQSILDERVNKDLPDGVYEKSDDQRGYYEGDFEQIIINPEKVFGLSHALQSGDAEQFAEYLDSLPDFDPNKDIYYYEENDNGVVSRFHLIEDAIFDHNPEILEVLLQKGLNPNFLLDTDLSSYVPSLLKAALNEELYEHALLLVNYGADPAFLVDGSIHGTTKPALYDIINFLKENTVKDKNKKEVAKQLLSKILEIKPKLAFIACNDTSSSHFNREIILDLIVRKTNMNAEDELYQIFVRSIPLETLSHALPHLLDISSSRYVKYNHSYDDTVQVIIDIIKALPVTTQDEQGNTIVLRDAQGRTALQMAYDTGNQTIIDAVEEDYLARFSPPPGQEERLTSLSLPNGNGWLGQGQVLPPLLNEQRVQGLLLTAGQFREALSDAETFGNAEYAERGNVGTAFVKIKNRKDIPQIMLAHSMHNFPTDEQKTVMAQHLQANLTLKHMLKEGRKRGVRNPDFDWVSRGPDEDRRFPFFAAPNYEGQWQLDGSHHGQERGYHARNNESEFLILEQLDRYLDGDHSAEGELTLFTERVPCLSCGKVIALFRQRYPGIDLKIIHTDGTILAPQNMRSEEALNVESGVYAVLPQDDGSVQMVWAPRRRKGYLDWTLGQQMQGAERKRIDRGRDHASGSEFPDAETVSNYKKNFPDFWPKYTFDQSQKVVGTDLYQAIVTDGLKIVYQKDFVEKYLSDNAFLYDLKSSLIVANTAAMTGDGYLAQARNFENNKISYKGSKYSISAMLIDEGGESRSFQIQINNSENYVVKVKKRNTNLAHDFTEKAKITQILSNDKEISKFNKQKNFKIAPSLFSMSGQKDGYSYDIVIVPHIKGKRLRSLVELNYIDELNVLLNGKLNEFEGFSLDISGKNVFETDDGDVSIDLLVSNNQKINTSPSFWLSNLSTQDTLFSDAETVSNTGKDGAASPVSPQAQQQDNVPSSDAVLIKSNNGQRPTITLDMRANKDQWGNIQFSDFMHAKQRAAYRKLAFSEEGQQLMADLQAFNEHSDQYEGYQEAVHAVASRLRRFSLEANIEDVEMATAVYQKDGRFYVSPRLAIGYEDAGNQAVNFTDIYNHGLPSDKVDAVYFIGTHNRLDKPQAGLSKADVDVLDQIVAYAQKSDNRFQDVPSDKIGMVSNDVLNNTIVMARQKSEGTGHDIDVLALGDMIPDKINDRKTLYPVKQLLAKDSWLADNLDPDTYQGLSSYLGDQRQIAAKVYDDIQIIQAKADQVSDFIFDLQRRMLDKSFEERLANEKDVLTAQEADKQSRQMYRQIVQQSSAVQESHLQAELALADRLNHMAQSFNLTEKLEPRHIARLEDMLLDSPLQESDTALVQKVLNSVARPLNLGDLTAMKQALDELGLEAQSADKAALTIYAEQSQKLHAVFRPEALQTGQPLSMEQKAVLEALLNTHEMSHGQVERVEQQSPTDKLLLELEAIDQTYPEFDLPFKILPEKQLDYSDWTVQVGQHAKMTADHQSILMAVPKTENGGGFEYRRVNAPVNIKEYYEFTRTPQYENLSGRERYLAGFPADYKPRMIDLIFAHHGMVNNFFEQKKFYNGEYNLEQSVLFAFLHELHPFMGNSDSFHEMSFYAMATRQLEKLKNINREDSKPILQSYKESVKVLAKISFLDMYCSENQCLPYKESFTEKALNHLYESKISYDELKKQYETNKNETLRDIEILIYKNLKKVFDLSKAFYDYVNMVAVSEFVDLSKFYSSKVTKERVDALFATQLPSRDELQAYIDENFDLDAMRKEFESQYAAIVQPYIDTIYERLGQKTAKTEPEISSLDTSPHFSDSETISNASPDPEFNLNPSLDNPLRLNDIQQIKENLKTTQLTGFGLRWQSPWDVVRFLANFDSPDLESLGDQLMEAEIWDSRRYGDVDQFLNEQWEKATAAFGTEDMATIKAHYWLDRNLYSLYKENPERYGYIRQFDEDNKALISRLILKLMPEGPDPSYTRDVISKIVSGDLIPLNASKEEQDKLIEGLAAKAREYGGLPLQDDASGAKLHRVFRTLEVLLNPGVTMQDFLDEVIVFISKNEKVLSLFRDVVHLTIRDNNELKKKLAEILQPVLEERCRISENFKNYSQNNIYKEKMNYLDLIQQKISQLQNIFATLNRAEFGLDNPDMLNFVRHLYYHAKTYGDFSEAESGKDFPYYTHDLNGLLNEELSFAGNEGIEDHAFLQLGEEGMIHLKRKIYRWQDNVPDFLRMEIAGLFEKYGLQDLYRRYDYTNFFAQHEMHKKPYDIFSGTLAQYLSGESGAEQAHDVEIQRQALNNNAYQSPKTTHNGLITNRFSVLDPASLATHLALTDEKFLSWLEDIESVWYERPSIGLSQPQKIRLVAMPFQSKLYLYPVTDKNQVLASPMEIKLIDDSQSQNYFNGKGEFEGRIKPGQNMLDPEWKPGDELKTQILERVEKQWRYHRMNSVLSRQFFAADRISDFVANKPDSVLAKIIAYNDVHKQTGEPAILDLIRDMETRFSAFVQFNGENNIKSNILTLTAPSRNTSRTRYNLNQISFTYRLGDKDFYLKALAGSEVVSEKQREENILNHISDILNNPNHQLFEETIKIIHNYIVSGLKQNIEIWENAGIEPVRPDRIDQYMMAIWRDRRPRPNPPYDQDDDQAPGGNGGRGPQGPGGGGGPGPRNPMPPKGGGGSPVTVH
jgi:hypothetical protein